MAFVAFMASTAGRAIRVLLGIALLVVAYLIGGTWGIVVAVVGLVPIAAGLFNFCLVAPLFGAPMGGGRAIRQV